MHKKSYLPIVFSAVMLLLSACASSGDNDGDTSGSQNGDVTDPDDGAQTGPSTGTGTGQTTSGSSGTSTAGQTETEVDPVLTESDYPSDPGEIAMTWNASLVKFPDGAGGVIAGTIDQLENGTLTSDQLLPVAIYLHGCSGFFSGSDFRMDWLASQGFVSIAPNSYARSFYPESCSLSTRQGWLYKPTIEMRQNDAANAIEQVRKFSWVDQDKVYIYGFSEGGVIAATLNSSKPQQQVAARVIESWNCITIPWTEYMGVSAPESEPLLTLFANQDPWLQGQTLTQNCADFISQTNGSQAFLIDYAPLNTKHLLLEAPVIQELVLNYLLQQQSSLSNQ